MVTTYEMKEQELADIRSLFKKIRSYKRKEKFPTFIEAFKHLRKMQPELFKDLSPEQLGEVLAKGKRFDVEPKKTTKAEARKIVDRAVKMRMTRDERKTGRKLTYLEAFEYLMVEKPELFEAMDAVLRKYER